MPAPAVRNTIWTGFAVFSFTRYPCCCKASRFSFSHRPSPATHSSTSRCASGTLFLDRDKPSSMTVAPGCISAIVRIVPEKPLPPCVVKGIMVFPLKSYSSKKEYSGIGRSLFQLG